MGALTAARGVASDAGLPPWVPLMTPFGEMRVREFGESSGPLAILIHGMNDKERIRNEWNPVAKLLAAEGFHVMVPDFHSAPKTLRPGALTGEAIRELISDSSETAFHRDGEVLGRAHGGRGRGTGGGTCSGVGCACNREAGSYRSLASHPGDAGDLSCEG